jgi:iron(III) transport system substrate-binding protein
MTPPPVHLRGLLTVSVLLLMLGACGPTPDLVVYCALDQEHSEELIRRFEDETGLVVRAEFDTEATKTIGLVGRIRAERNRVRCDVFWNNEIANTVALAEDGLLAPYDSPSAADIPAAFRDSEHRWTGFAARARVFIVNTELVSPADLASIRGMWDLLEPRWAGKVGMARPLTGTTLTHMTALYGVLGDERAEEYLTRIKAANGRGELDLTGGNALLARKVRDGVLAWGWTDTDDYFVAQDAGYPVAVIYPDQPTAEEPDAPGTLVIPNTVCLLAGAPHADAGKRFIDWVLGGAIEADLAASRTMQIPVRASVPRPDYVPRFGPGQRKAMDVDFRAAGKALPARQQHLKELFVE